MLVVHMKIFLQKNKDYPPAPNHLYTRGFSVGV